jgi:hypothetical protein
MNSTTMMKTIERWVSVNVVGFADDEDDDADDDDEDNVSDGAVVVVVVGSVVVVGVVVLVVVVVLWKWQPSAWAAMVVFIFKDMINKVFTRCQRTVVKQIYEQFASGVLFCREVFVFEPERIQKHFLLMPTRS